MRLIEPINYDWQFKQHYAKIDEQVGNFNGFISINLPHSNYEVPYNNFDEKSYQIISSYKKILNIEHDATKNYRLRFEGIAHKGQLMINGNMVGEHFGGYIPWEIDITKWLHQGENELLIIVDAHENNQPPFGNVVDYLAFGGIYRTVSLITSDECYLTDIYFRYFDVLTDQANWQLEYQMSEQRNGKIYLAIYDENDLILACNHVIDEQTWCGKLPKITLWDVDFPKLYRLHVSIVLDNGMSDEITQLIGFRECQFTKDGFWLNGKRLQLRGLNRHQMYPYVGYAMPASAQIDDAKILKQQLALNIVRTSHYPQDPSFLTACDELGLLVFEEMPGWQHIGDDAWQKLALANLEAMIKRDRYHPSIVLWGVRINESMDDSAFYQATNCLAKRLDPDRQTGGVRCIKNSELLEDVYTYNDFQTSKTAPYISIPDTVTSCNAPYLITEFAGHMYPTKPYDNEKRRTNVSLLHKNIIKAASEYLNIAGTIGWCFADYNTHKDFGSGDGICYHGVLDMFRNPKLSSYVYQSFGKEPFLEVSSTFDIGEYNASMIPKIVIYTNLDQVEFYRNDDLIATFTCDGSIDTHVIEVTDLIGDILVKCEKMSIEESMMYRQLIQSALANPSMTEQADVPPAVIQKAIALYSKYVCNWGDKSVHYHFIGKKAGKTVKEVNQGPEFLTGYQVSISDNTMHVRDHYQVARVTIKALTDLDNVAHYAFDTFTLMTTSGLAIIGPKTIGLIAGYGTFWVKSLHQMSSHETVSIVSERFGKKEITINIQND